MNSRVITLTNSIEFKNIRNRRVSPELKNSATVKRLLSLQSQLKWGKSKLDKHVDIISADKFSKISSIFDPFKREKYNIEKKIGNYGVTNAWIKCYEILEKFHILDGLISLGENEITHFDNASLPGSFLLSTHHYIKTMYSEYDYSWKASSLIDDSKTHLGDSYDLYKNYSENWIFT